MKGHLFTDGLEIRGCDQMVVLRVSQGSTDRMQQSFGRVTLFFLSHGDNQMSLLKKDLNNITAIINELNCIITKKME